MGSKLISHFCLLVLMVVNPPRSKFLSLREDLIVFFKNSHHFGSGGKQLVMKTVKIVKKIWRHTPRHGNSKTFTHILCDQIFGEFNNYARNSTNFLSFQKEPPVIVNIWVEFSSCTSVKKKCSVFLQISSHRPTCYQQTIISLWKSSERIRILHGL